MDRQSPLALVPGVALLIATAIVAVLSAPSRVGLDPIIVSIAIGLVAGNLFDLPAAFDAGIATHDRWLEAGIVVLGATVAVDRIAASGPALVGLVLVVMAVSIAFVELLARVAFGVERELSSLLAAGLSVCGVSAAITVAGSIRARSETVAYVVTAILLFDTITLFAYPAVGSLLGLSDRVFGIWAGVSMLSTGPATAAGFAHSQAAGEWATVAKLARNACIGVVAVGYAIAYATDSSEAGVASSAVRIVRSVPRFVVGFLVLMALAAAGAFSDGQIAALETVDTWLFLLAFAGLGYDIDVRELQGVGVEPLALLAIAFGAISTISLLAVSAIF